MRVAMLQNYGVDDALAAIISDAAGRKAEIGARAGQWAQHFDANALLTIMTVMASFDIRADLASLQARLLYVLSRTDPIFPPSLAASTMAELAAAGVAAEYFEIDSDAGHSAASAHWAVWAPVLGNFISRRD